MPESMRRLLIVSPHFPPSNTADSQRVRMLLPFFSENGWEATVLAVKPEQVAAPLDPWLEEGLPVDIEISRVNALSLKWQRVPGLGSLDLRAIPAMKRNGDALLVSKSFDLAYFSTTVFGVHVLGPYWKKKFGLPFVMDYQDPWVSDYYSKHPEIVPPGGRLKFAITQWLARKYEPRVLKECAGITSVSPDYPKNLKIRYSQIAELKSQVLPFPASIRDLDRIDEQTGDAFNQTKCGECINWVYVGRGGKDMQTAVSSLFKAVSDWRKGQSKEAGNLRIHFVGTSYAPAGQGEQTIMPLAEKYGLVDIVTEVTDRIPYSEMLRYLKNADALIVPGSDDPAYTASKIYPYLMARKPLLAVFHENSSVVNLIKSVGGGKVVTFSSGVSLEELAKKIRYEWLESYAYKKAVPLDSDGFKPFTNQVSTNQLCKFFNRVLAKE